MQLFAFLFLSGIFITQVRKVRKETEKPWIYHFVFPVIQFVATDTK